MYLNICKQMLASGSAVTKSANYVMIRSKKDAKTIMCWGTERKEERNKLGET